MESKINIAELLKDCPKGMELDCTIYEEDVTFIQVLEEHIFPITINTPEGQISLNKYGCYSNNKLSKCVIFPKGKTTWEGFEPPCKFKAGDIITCGWNERTISYSWSCILAKAPEKVIDNYFINNYCSLDCNGGFLSYNSEADSATWVRFATEEEKQKLFNAIKENGYKWNEETKMLEKLTPNFEGGDVVVSTSNIIHLISCRDKIDGWESCCSIIHGKFDSTKTVHIIPARFATEKEKQQLFDAIKANGYKWNAEKKCLEKLVEPRFKAGNKIKKCGYRFTIAKVEDDYYLTKCGNKIPIDNQDDFRLVSDRFDITTLKPFDKVLGKNIDTGIWECDFYSKFMCECVYEFHCVGTNYKHCIPYEGNEHLLGTTNDCDDFYKTWE